MNRILIALAIVLSCTGNSFAQPTGGKAFVVEIANGVYAGYMITSDGNVYSITSLTITKPNPPPPPITKTVRAVLLQEAKDQTPAMSLLIGDIQNNATIQGMKKFQVLDQNAKDQDNVPVAFVQAILKAMKESSPPKKLPQLAGISADGSVSFLADVPKTVEEVVKILKDNGL